MKETLPHQTTWTLSSAPLRLPAAFVGPFAIADTAGLDVYRDGFLTLQGQRKLLVNRYTFAMAENNLARRWS